MKEFSIIANQVRASRTTMKPNTEIHSFYLEIAGQLEKLAENKASKARLDWFKQQHKNSTNKAYGIKAASVRKLIKNHTHQFKQLDLNDKLDLAKEFYKSRFFEQTIVGDALVEFSAESMAPANFALLDDVVSFFSNWPSVDWLCLHVMQPLLLQYKEATLELLRKWNRSENMWKRRASVVTFVRKIGSSGKFTETVLEFCDNLVWDEEDLVRKGVGWALKDSIASDKKRILEYIKSLRRKGVSSKITLYAIQDLKGKERREVLQAKPRV